MAKPAERETTLQKSAKNFIAFLEKKRVLDSEQKGVFERIEQTRLMFGVLAIREKYVEFEDLQKALEERAMSDNSTEKIGTTLIRKGLMTSPQVETILEIQKKEKDIPAELVINMGIFTHAEVEGYLKEFLGTAAKS